jgi:hypothetical protein
VVQCTLIPGKVISLKKLLFSLSPCHNKYF